MRTMKKAAARIASGLAATMLLVSAGTALAQTVTNVGLTAAPTQTTLPDGTAVPMWGYSCASASTNCAALNPNAGTNWSPVVISVPYSSAGTTLNIALTNGLTFAAGAANNTVPTSLVIVGQIGGGLGGGGSTTASPTHPAGQVTWPVATTGATNTPVPQLPRVQSFGTEVAAGATTTLTWSNLRPGTYLIESGTHPSIQAPMGLYGILVVTTPASTTGTVAPAYTYSSCAAATTAAAAAECDSYDANVPLLLSEIDPAQNTAVAAAVANANFSETRVWSGQPTGPDGNPGCGNPNSGAYYQSCYPPTVNYSPRYYLLNGDSFDRTTLLNSTVNVLAAGATPTTNRIMLNIVNAGSRMHVPTVVGLPLTLVAEDGNKLPGLPRIQNEVFMAAGKTFDLLVTPAQTPATTTTAATYAGANYPIFDRALSLSTNNSRDGGMQGYIAVAGGSLTGVGSVAGTGTTASIGAYTYYCTAGSTLAVTDPSKGVLAGATGANGATLTGTAGSVTTANLVLQSNGTFIYSPPAGSACGGSFTFAVNGGQISSTATINECDSTVATGACVMGAAPKLNDDTYTASNGAQFQIASPGVLLNDVDPSGLPLQVDTTSIVNTNGDLSLVVNPDGSFAASLTTPCTKLPTSLPNGLGNKVYTPGICSRSFQYNVKNQQGTASGAVATVTVNFPGGSGLALNLLDGKNPTWPAINDYRWVIEEDDTMWTDPKCQVATSGTRPNDSYGHACPPMPVESIGYNFHTANMKVVATGCVGTISCQSGQTVWNGSNHAPTICDIGDGVCRTTDTAGNALTTATAVRAPLLPSAVYLDPNKHYFISVLPGDAINPTIATPSSGLAGNTIPTAAQCTANGQAFTPTSAENNAWYGIAGGATGGGPVTTQFTCVGNTTSGFTLQATTRQFNPAVDCPTAADYAPGAGKCGHNLSGRQIAPPFDQAGNALPNAVTIAMAETPLPTARIAVEIYEDDYPLNGENDAGGGVDILAPNEHGLGSFQVELLDQGGQFGDNNGQPTYDMFNMPLSNSLNGTLDPSTGLNACPISSNGDNIVGMIVTCPQYESDGTTLSPLAGQAIIENLYPGLYEVAAVAGADRIARGEQWIQTNTLDGGKPHEAFVRPGEPSYFQEFGPGGFHVNMGFANPKIINNRRTNSAGTGLCDAAPTGGGLTCNSSISGQVHGDHMARTPDERTYDTGSYDAMKFSNCYVALSIPDEQTIAFTTCDAAGNFSISGLPDGVFQMAVFDQWNDIMLDGLVAAVTVSGNTVVQPTVIQWRTNVYTRTYLDVGTDGTAATGAGNGIPDRDANGVDLEPGLPFVPIHLRYRDGSIGFKMSTDLNGYATNNEVFPFMNWLVMEPDTTRFKPTGVHVIYDAGGPDDCSAAALAANGPAAGAAGKYKCSIAASHLAATLEQNSLPTALRIPGAMYCADADCVQAPGAANSAGAESILNGPYYLNNGVGGTLAANSGLVPGAGSYLSSGRIDPPWAIMEGFQGLLGQHSFFDYGFKPFKAADPTAGTPAENGGIFGHVAYASTRPFDDPTLLVQNPWEPLIPNVQINLYQVSTNADGFTTLTLVDTTTTSSWDKYAQGFRTDGSGTGTLLQNTDNSRNPVTNASNNGYVTNMNCPGQDPTSPFFQTLQGSKEWLDSADPTTGLKKNIAWDSQFKCFDGWALMNQIQPVPYDGRYQFPSVVDRNPQTGRPSGQGQLNGVATPMAGTNCTICIANPDDGNPMLPAGTYVVEAITPPGWSMVKEEDKNILVGDQFIAPVTQQFAGLGNVFILPDQAAMNAYYNANNAQNATTNLGVLNLPRSDFNNTVDQVWPCVGAMRVVPDFLSLFPMDNQVSPFAGATRPLCDRKEVVLSDQMSANTQFFMFTETHVAGHFTGMMTNDMASEFDPFSPQFGEKFGAADLPVNMRDFTGTEMSRVYGDQWGVYNGMYMSTWEVNPPNPTGYAPQMSVACMNDPGPILDTNPSSPTYLTNIVDPAYNPAYSNFCYEQMFMPGMTNYMDTPVTPVMAFADHYNLPDAEFPNGTPMVKRADFKGDNGGAGNGLSGTGATYSKGNGPWSPASAGVGTLTVVNAGSGYVAAPTVTFNPTGATATATLKVAAVNVSSAGSYTAVPTVTFDAAPAGGVTATGTACLGPVSASITAGGTGYSRTNPPAVTLTPAPIAGTGTVRATAVVSTAGAVTGITFRGNGCFAGAIAASIAAPTIGTRATASVVSGVASVNLTNAGSGYTSEPAVAFSGSGGAAAAASMSVGSLVVLTPGVYATTPTVTLTAAPAGGKTATATAALGSLVATAGDLTIQAVGDMPVQNPNYTGPSGLGAPYNTKTITRHYGFGVQCSAPIAGCAAPYNAAVSSVTVGGVPATITGWGDTQITVTMPTAVPACPVLQSTSTATKKTSIPQQCGEVVITSGNGKQSITGITVTIGGKTPKLITTASPSSASFGEFYTNPIQTAIDSAATAPGDLLIVDAGSYRENVIMWKPLRLQGVGAGAVTINADAQPAGKMDAWRRRVDCLFGLQLNGWTNANNAQFNADGEPYTCPANMYFRADRLPFEGFVGWDASSNGNLAQVLQEPSLMGAYEGAGITVVGRGIRQPNASDLWGMGGGAGTYVNGSVYLTSNASDCGTATTNLPGPLSGAGDFGTGNFLCNPSGIDGLTITNSSQGGGGVFLHGFNDNFEIANSRIVANAGTLSGGINVGNGESPPVSVNDGTLCGPGVAAPAPLCPPTGVASELGIAMPKTNAVIPSQLQVYVHIHHNQVIDNASIGDALFSGSPAGAGGITISAGSDDYEVDHNWVAGNLTSSDGGGIAHMGVSFNGSIHNNWVLFNEANNPTLSVDGGGIIVMGAQEDRTLITTQQECGGTTDTDCPPGIGDGTGPGLVIDSNLILGNSAAYGSGGGLRMRQTNGTEVANFPSTPDTDWYGITVTNNIIVNNVAGWDGGGVSLQDSFKTSLINNTIASNDTTASAGVLFKTLGAINEASPAPGCVPTPDPSQPQAVGCLNPNAPHIPQPAGLVTMQNTPNMMASLNGFISPEAVVTKTTTTGGVQGVTCPKGFGYGDAANFGNDSNSSLVDGRCILVSLPKLVNNLFWQNRAFHVEMVDGNGVPLGNQGNTTPNGTGLQSQQNIIALLPTFTQTATGQCVDPTGLKNTDGSALQLYWDLGVRMDTLPNAQGHALYFNSATIGSGFSLEAVLAATINGAGSVNSVTLTANGGFYTSAPTVTVTGGGPAMNASISGNTLTVQSVAAGSGAASATASAGTATGTTVTVGGTINGAFAVGQTLSGTGIAAGATINAIDTTGTILTVSLANTGAVSGAVEAYTAAPPIAINQRVAGLGVVSGTVVTGLGTGTGGVGTYTVNNVQTVALEPMTYGVVPAVVTLTVNLVPTSATYGQVTAVKLVSGGSGYTSVPSVTLTGGGLTANVKDASNTAGIALQAVNSMFSDGLNLANLANATATGNGNLTTAANDTAPASADGSGLFVGHYCNGARIPPEQCGTQQGANNSGMCLGYFTPAGISENVGVPQVFRFANIAATATVDEGNNWINMTYGPLTLSRPSNTETTATVTTAAPTATEQMLTVGSVGGRTGAYSLPLGSAAIDAGAPVTGYGLATDYYGNPRTSGPAPDIGAVEFPDVPVDLSITNAASVTSTLAGTPYTYTITVSNAATGSAVTGATVTDSAPAGVTFTGWTCAASGAGNACGTTSGAGSIATTVSLAAGGSVVFTVDAVAPSAGTMVDTATVAPPKGYGDTNPANNTASASVTITAPAPVLSGISPAIAAPGTFGNANISLTLTGQFLSGATAVNVSGAGMSCPARTIAVNAAGTTLTVTCQITTTAPLGARNVTVTTPAGTSGAESFWVGEPGFSLGGTGTLTVGTTVRPTTTVTLTNTNSVNETIETLLVNMATTNGTGTNGTFSVTTASTCQPGVAIVPGGTCNLVITLNNPDGRTVNGTLTVNGIVTSSSAALPTATRGLTGN